MGRRGTSETGRGVAPGGGIDRETGTEPEPATDRAAEPDSDAEPRRDAGPDRADGRRRVVVENVSPQVDCGRFAAKRIAGEDVVVEADAYTDGHDAVRCVLLHRALGNSAAGTPAGTRAGDIPAGDTAAGDAPWREAPMEPIGNDRWRGRFPTADLGRYAFTVEAWVDPFATWRLDLVKRLGAGQDVSVPLEVGVRLVEEAAARADDRAAEIDAARLRQWVDRLRAEAAAEGKDEARASESAGEARAQTESETPSEDSQVAPDDAAEPAASRSNPAPMVDRATRTAGDGGPSAADHPALSRILADLVARHPDRRRATRHAREIEVWADRPKARFSAWYEFFPRSTGPRSTGPDSTGPAEAHGTFRTAMEFLPYVASMGFDVVYLPPVHPIGRTHRKGPNNAIVAGPDDPGSPWAIGAAEGGHTAVHPDLGTLADFGAFRERAEELGLEVALDVAFQCSPDHPWVEDHPEWFRHRPDGSIQYAENPPKKYEDIYPFDFESEAWPELWEALKGIFDFWIDQGVRIFRVDNPHTKPFAFWEWAIGEIRAARPDVIFLSEAFTRPKVMYRLAKLGFTQSYTYFAWRNAKWEIEGYLGELTTPPVSDFFRPSFWPNTPDILTETLQTGGRPAFMARLVLAATLSASYGIYGPPFEHMESHPREPGSEEYLDSEKYQIRDWDVEREDSLRHFISRVNRIRRAHPALHRNDGLAFHAVDNDALIAYSKRDPATGDAIVAVVNLDPNHTRSGWIELDLDALDLPADESYQMHDLLGGARYLWHGPRNYVELNPHVAPAHVFHVARRARTERDFEYFL